MTLRLHKKHPITPPSVPAATVPKPVRRAVRAGLFAAICGAATLPAFAADVPLVTSSASTITQAASADTEPRRIEIAAQPIAAAQASTNVKSNGKLQWRSIRRGTPAAQAAPTQGHTRLVAHEQNSDQPTPAAAPMLISASQAKGPARLAQLETGVDDPFDDPFGDKEIGLPKDARPIEELESDLPKREPFDPLENPADLEPTAPGTGEIVPLDKEPMVEPKPMIDLPAEPEPAPEFGEVSPLPQNDRLKGSIEAECEAAFRDLVEKKLSDIDLAIRSEGVEGRDYPQACDLDEGVFEGRHWSSTNFCWTASALCHKPLYFEEVNLERYGHTWGPVAQPAISAAHFFLSVPVLPYKMGVTPPGECIYALGYYRPGDCAPHFIPPIPISARGALFQAGAMVGVIAALP